MNQDITLHVHKRERACALVDSKIYVKGGNCITSLF